MTMDQLVAPAGAELLPGFPFPAEQSQIVFRALMDALSRPGQVMTLAADWRAPAPLDAAAGAIGLALLDSDTTVWLPRACGDAANWLRFHTGCRIARDIAAADFVFAPALVDGLDPAQLCVGTDEEPHRSAMVIAGATTLSDGPSWRLVGPGIEGVATLQAEGLASALLARREALAPQFPRGFDMAITCGARLAALPRTTRIEV
jgi:alpha-D-ribose 1-methylphosphonate 5-triphosphate synthase subunit PhnH